MIGRAIGYEKSVDNDEWRCAEASGKFDRNLRVLRETKRMHEDFDKAVEKWCKRSSLTIRESLRQGEAKYKAFSLDLLDFLQAEMLAKLSARGEVVKAPKAALNSAPPSNADGKTAKTEGMSKEAEKGGESKMKGVEKKWRRTPTEEDQVTKKMGKAMMKLAAMDLF